MRLFARNRSGHPLIDQDVISRLAHHGKARYDGTPDVWDPWPVRFSLRFEALPAPSQARALTALVDAVTEEGGWSIYGAEELIGAPLATPGAGGERDRLFTLWLDFQRAGGVWWNELSIQARMFWAERNPGATWLPEQPQPSRADARITPLPVGGERRLSALTRAPDSRATYVTRPETDRYVWQLRFVDDDDDDQMVTEDRGAHGDLYDLYTQLARDLPIAGLWADPEFARFLPYAMPTL